ncbi:ABC transporter permease [Actinacidiphila paucisporea]|uniref:Peptide/nickel transport system permease protein n=1 Tax=Actinacidiphila paucisporea TaxID=310782 RepID=A0A1M7QEP4_9ACTN|nr:ABC transporter permease [Actinacidiphila paucisporea]SHN29343.1 peptide/nickel transport system permease protein [Actinacidiphila paucisporea]
MNGVSGMPRYLLWRVGQALFVVWAAFTISFAVLYTLPSDPVAVMAGPNSELTPAELAAMRHDLGLDRPVLTQYLSQLGHLLRGDLGQSIQSREQVSHLIGQALPPTAAITAAGLGAGLLCGTALALATSLVRQRWARGLLDSLPPLGVSVPSYWVGLLLLQQFSFHWHLFPAIGNEGAGSMVLPTITLALPVAAVIAQLLGRSLDAALREGYADTARAKGVSRLAVHVRHGLRNAVLPAMTMVGLLVGGMLSGSVVVETVFSRDGLGRLATTAVSQQDLPVVQGLVLLGAAVFAAVNLLVDLLYPVIDPRIVRQ